MALAKSLTINGMVMPNRTFFAPMTRRCADPASKGPSNAVARYYARRAAGGFGLIITEGVFVNDHNARNKEMCPLCRTDEQIEGWKAVVAECKRVNPNVKMCMQLWHVGAWSIAPIAPSESPVPGGQNIKVSPDPSSPKAKAATREDLDNIVADFVLTAVNAVQRCGFDSVEVHGAHGYFIDIFNDVFYNRRKEEEGLMFHDGDTAARSGFGVYLTKALRAALGPDVPIIFRFSQWEAQDLQCVKYQASVELKAFLVGLREAGVDGFDVSTRLWSAPAFPDEHPTLGLAGWCKKLLLEDTPVEAGATREEAFKFSSTTLPAVLAVGGLTISRLFLDVAGLPPGATPPSTYELTDPTPCLEALGEGAFDGVGIGRVALTNPDWPNKVMAGKWQELKPFTDADKEYGQVDN